MNMVSQRTVLTLLSVTPYSWFLGYLKGYGTKKNCFTESSVNTGLCDTIFIVFRLSHKGSGTKKNGVTESSVDTALCDTIFMAFRLSQRLWNQKKISVTESSFNTALCDTIFRFLGYLKKVMEPKKKLCHREQCQHCSLWHHIHGFRLSQRLWNKKIDVTESSVDTALCDTIFRFLGYLKKVLEQKKLVSQRAVLTLFSVTQYSWLLGYLKGYRIKKKLCHRKQCQHCSLWHYIHVFRLSQRLWNQKKLVSQRAMSTLLSVTPYSGF